MPLAVSDPWIDCSYLVIPPVSRQESEQRSEEAAQDHLDPSLPGLLAFGPAAGEPETRGTETR